MSPVLSSIDSPWMPVFVAAETLAATCSGSTAKPPSKSPFTGRSVLAAIVWKCRSASSRDTRLSARPNDHANPELVVANAGNPRCASSRALPTSHGLGMTKQPA